MIRIATEGDIPAILDIYAPYILTTTITFEYDVPTLPEFTQRFRDITTEFSWLVWEENEEILGYAYAAHPFTRATYRWCAEPSVYIKQGAQGRGIGHKLYAALEEILKLQGYQVLYALITGENGASISFHKKQGYTLCGKFTDCGFKLDRWIGVIWMEKRLKAVEIPKSFPSPFPALMQDYQRISDILYNLSLS